MDLAKGSKVFLPCKENQKRTIKNERLRSPIRLQSAALPNLRTTALARPQVDTPGIELHEEDVLAALDDIAIQGAARVACHQGIAH